MTMLDRTILHSLWQGAVIALLLIIALPFARSARTRYALACGAMLLMFAGFALTLLLFVTTRTHPAAPTTSLRPFALTGGSGMILPAWYDSASLPWLTPLWIMGVIMVHLYGLAGWVYTRRLRMRGVCPAPELWQSRLSGLGALLRVSKPIALLESCLAKVPVVIGILSPVILLPLGMLASMAPRQVEAILLHELAHIRRRDYLINLLQTVVEGFLFYHPATWWISGVIRAERENCCDDLAVSVTGDTAGYAAALTALEQTRSFEFSAAMAATGGSLMSRINRLLAPRQNRPGALAPLLSVVILALAAVTLTAWQTPPSQWQNWVNEDVAYIITDQERAAYQGLTTDQERIHFVEQFWERRDPTPGTPRNEFKEEHYRRIAYANQHFGGTQPGWKTDQGRIYITYGPPDEIDAHPDGGVYSRPLSEGGGQVLTYPFQQWLYRYIQGIGENVKMEFVDGARTGEYHMTRDPREKYENSDHPVDSLK